MKVIAINGSPKKRGNTFTALTIVADRLKTAGIEVEIVQVGSMKLSGCIACNACARAQKYKCMAFDDELNDIIAKVMNSDGIILGSPVYFAGVSGTMKAFLDRLFFVFAVHPPVLRHKVGAGLVAVRRSGGMTTLDELNKYLQYCEMILPTSNYWNVIHGFSPAEILQDEEGVQILEVLGKNMAWIMQVIAESDVPRPEPTSKVLTNFVR